MVLTEPTYSIPVVDVKSRRISDSEMEIEAGFIVNLASLTGISSLHKIESLTLPQATAKHNTTIPPTTQKRQAICT